MALYISVGLTLALWYVIPFGRSIAYPLTLLSTFVHELGHGLAALTVGHEFHSMEIHWDGSGVTHSAGTGGKLSLAWIAAGGLVGPAIGAAILFNLGRHLKAARITLGTLGIFMLFLDIWVVRNVFGFVFVALWAVVFLAIAIKGTKNLSRFSIIFLGSQLALSVFCRADYLFTPVARTANGDFPSDVGLIADALWLPYWFWGLVCGGFSLAVLGIGVANFYRKS